MTYRSELQSVRDGAALAFRVLAGDATPCETRAWCMARAEAIAASTAPSADYGALAMADDGESWDVAAIADVIGAAIADPSRAPAIGAWWETFGAATTIRPEWCDVDRDAFDRTLAAGPAAHDERGRRVAQRSDGTVRDNRRRAGINIGGRADRTADGRPLSDDMAAIGALLGETGTAQAVWNANHVLEERGLLPRLMGNDDVMPADRALIDAARFLAPESGAEREQNAKHVAGHMTGRTVRAIHTGDCKARRRETGDKACTCPNRTLTWSITERTWSWRYEITRASAATFPVDVTQGADRERVTERKATTVVRKHTTIVTWDGAKVRDRNAARTRKSSARAEIRALLATLAEIGQTINVGDWNVTCDAPAGRLAAQLSATNATGQTITGTPRTVVSAIA